MSKLKNSLVQLNEHLEEYIKIKELIISSVYKIVEKIILQQY